MLFGVKGESTTHMNSESQSTTGNRREFFTAACRNTALAGMGALVALQGLKRRRIGNLVLCWTPGSCWECAESPTCPRSFRVEQSNGSGPKGSEGARIGK